MKRAALADKGGAHDQTIVDLQAEIEQMRADLDLRNQTALDRKKAIVELEAEKERLRAGLIASSDLSGHVSWVHNCEEACTELRRRNAIAQRALGGDVQTAEEKTSCSHPPESRVGYGNSASGYVEWSCLLCNYHEGGRHPVDKPQG